MWYNYLRESELEAALAESLQDVETGKIYKESVDDHIRRLKREV